MKWLNGNEMVLPSVVMPTPVFLPGKFHGQRSLVGYSPWGRKESDTTECLHFLSVDTGALVQPDERDFIKAFI